MNFENFVVKEEVDDLDIIDLYGHLMAVNYERIQLPRLEFFTVLKGLDRHIKAYIKEDGGFIQVRLVGTFIELKFLLEDFRFFEEKLTCMVYTPQVSYKDTDYKNLYKKYFGGEDVEL